MLETRFALKDVCVCASWTGAKIQVIYIFSLILILTLPQSILFALFTHGELNSNRIPNLFSNGTANEC